MSHEWTPPNTHTVVDTPLGPDTHLQLVASQPDPPEAIMPPKRPVVTASAGDPEVTRFDPDHLPEKWAFASKTVVGIASSGILIVFARIGWPGLDAYVREIIQNVVDLAIVPAALGWAYKGRLDAGKAASHRLYLIPRTKQQKAER